MKKNQVALLFIVAAIALDYTFSLYARQLSQDFQMGNLTALMRLRPLLLTVFYGLLCIAAARASETLSLYLMAPIAIFLIYVALPVFNTFIPLGLQLPQSVENVVRAVATSPLALTLNTGSLILGFGLFQLLASRSK